MAKDIIHDQVKNALIKDGWTITHDPFTIAYGTDHVFADLAAERSIAAERGNEKIIVEIKSFVGQSAINDFEGALGKYVLYQTVLAELPLEHKLCLAIGTNTYKKVFQRSIIKLTVERHNIPLIIVDIDTEEIING